MDRKENPFDQFDQKPANQFDQFEVTQSDNPFDQFDQLGKVAAPVARGPIKGPAQRTVVPPAAAPVAPVTAEDYLEPATSAPPPLSEAVRSQLDRKYDALSPQDRDAIIRGRTKDGRQTLEGMYFAYRDKQFAARDADTAAFAKQLGPMAYRLSDLTDPRKESRARMAREQGASDKTAENIAAQAAIEGLPAEEVVPQAKESKFDFDLAARYKDLNPVVRGAVKGYYGYKQSVLGLNQALGDLVGATDFADTQKAGAETAGGSVEAIGERPDYLSRNFEGAVSSVVQNIPGILGGIVTGGALVPLSVLGVQSFGQNYTEGVSRGLTRDLAAQRAGVFAAAEILGERFGLAGLTNGIRKAFGKKSFEEASDAVSRYIVSQIPGEQLTTATQFLADKYPSFALNPQAGIKEYLQQAGDTLTQTIMQGGLMMGGVKGAQFLATGRFGAELGEQPPIAGRPPEEPPMAPTEEPPIAPSGAPGGERIEPTVAAEPTITPERVEPAFGAEPAIEPAVEPEEPGVPGMVTTEMLAPESVEQPEGRVAPDETATPPAAKAAVTPVQEPSNETAAVGMAVQEVPLRDLTLSKDVPQFKMGADTKGVVEPLGGKFERTGVAPIQVWRRLDGSLEVISGRHRLDLARRSGEKTIPAQIHDESQGFTPTMAAILDAELNIRDGQGKVKDYVNYFKAAGITPEDAESRGLLARSTGKRAYTIATTGSDELVAAVRNDQVGDEAAYYIALNAPNDPRLQSVGMQAVMDGKSANLAVNTMNALKALGMEQDTTTDMFGFDDSAMKEAAAMAQVANKKQREIQTRLAAITGAAKNPAVAKAEGIDVRDPEAVNRRIGELRQMKNAWDNWATSPELIGEIRQARGVEAPGLTLRGETEAEIRAREQAAAAEEQRRRSEEEAAKRAEQAEVERKRAEETTDLFQLGQTAEQQMSGMGDLFAEPAAPAKAPREAPEFPFEEGARVRFLPTDTSPLGGGVAEGQIIGLDKTSGENYRVRLRLDKDAPQGGGKMERVVYSNAGTFEAAEAPATAPEAEAKPAPQKPAAKKEAKANEYFVENLGETLPFPDIIEWYRIAYRNMEQARDAYRKGEINDEQFLDQKNEFDEIKAEVEKIEAKEYRKPKEKPTEKAARVVSMTERRQAQIEREEEAEEAATAEESRVEAIKRLQKEYKPLAQKIWGAAFEAKRVLRESDFPNSLQDKALQRQIEELEDVISIYNELSSQPPLGADVFNTLPRAMELVKSEGKLERLEELTKLVAEKPPKGAGKPKTSKEEPGLFNIEVPGKRDQATWSPDRINALVREFVYRQEGRENDTKAYAAFVNPVEFVRATTEPGEFRQELLRAEEGLDIQRLREEIQTPFLEVEFVPGEGAAWRIQNHEGRHRMAALAASGVKRVPVLIRMVGEAKAWPPVAAQWLSGQRFGEGRREKGDFVQITDLTPISFARRDELQKKFAGEGIAFSIERPEAKTTKRMSDEDIRDEQIREYSALRQRLAAVPRRIAAGKGALPDGPAKGMTELERVYLKSLVDRAQDLKAAIKISAPRLDSPEQFLARALKEYDAGNISKEVLDVIQAAYKQQPGLLNGLKLSIKQAPEGAGRVAGAFLNMSRIVRLYKGSSGVDDPKTIRHELTHSLEQMMTPEQRGVIIDKWQDDLAKAIRKHKDAAHQKYFEALLKFLDKPTMENYKAAIAALPSYDMYQFINPSEYWAVNAENLMASQLGGPWQRFKAAMKRMFEALKDLFGFDNKYAVQRVFKDIMTGSKERVTTEMLADRAGVAVSPAQNIEEDKALIEKYKRPKTPMLDKKPLATFLLDQFKNGKDLFKDFVENPKEAAADAGNSLIDGALRARMATVWYGAGLESRDFAKYGGQLRTSEDLATASVALDNAIRSGNIGVEVIFRGGLKFDNSKKQLVAVETKKGMRGVYEAERRLKDKLGNQLGTDVIQGYLEAKRSISIMNEFYDRQAAYEGAKENLKMLREQGASEKKIKKAVALMESAESSLESVKKAVSSVTMTEDEMYEFAARDKVHPELREIMDNWTAVNQNLLRIWRDVGLLSPERYEALASIQDYVPWYRIMQDEEDPHTPLLSTTRGLTNIGREKLFKRTKPTDVLDFKGKEGKKVLDESGNLIGMSFKVPPSTVLRVEVDGEKIKAKDLSVTDDGRVMVKTPIDDASLVVFKVTRPIQNIVDNMTQNVMRMTMNAIRQYAAGRIVSEYATRDPDGRIMTFPKEDLAKGRFSFVINGQRKVVEISDPLPLGAIYGMDSLNLKMYALPAAFANFFRRTITLSGVFQLKQVFKDAPTAAAVTGVRNPAALILGTYKGLITALLQPVGKKVGIDIEPVVDILKAAGIGGFQNPSRTPEAEVKRRLGIMNRNVFDFVIKALDHIGDSADMAQRIAVYKRVMAETGNETQALYQAANVINFLHHGSSGTAQTLVKTVPFMGAYANAMDVLVNSLIGGGLKGMSRRKAIARLSVTTGMLIGITLLYTMLVSGDDDYEELDDQTKLRNFIIPGTDIMLPMNTSYAFFWKAMTEMLYNEAIKKATPNEIDRTRLKKALSTAARDMLLGPEPVPQIIKGPVEIAIGYNFFTGRDIIPEGLKNVETFQQYTAATSELGKWFSSYTEVPGTDGKRILSPIEADHLIRSTFGTAGALGQWVTNRIAVEAGTRPELTEKETPITGAFLRPEVDRGREDLFYDLRDRVNQKYNTLRELERDDEKKAEAYDEKYEDLLDMHKDVNKIAADLSDINAEIRELSTSKDIKMTPAERRAEIRALQQEKKEVLDDIYELRKEAGL